MTRTLTVLFLLSGLGPSLWAQQVVRRGSEFRVNSYTTGYQGKPAVARAPNGDFVVAWWGRGPSATSGYDVFARRFDLSGTPVGPELLMNVWTEGRQDNPSVVATTNGEFVVVWSGEGDDDAKGIFGRVIDASGQALGNEFRVNAFEPGVQTDPAVAADSAGNLTVVWSGDGGTFDYDGVFGRRLDARGNPLTGEFAANSHIAGVQNNPAVASMPDGHFVVLWQGAGQGNGAGVMGRTFTAGGEPLFPVHFDVNSYVQNTQAGPAVASDGAGDLFIAWHSEDQDGDQDGIYGRRYLLTTGAYPGGEFRVNTQTAAAQYDPSVAEYDGSYIVVWASDAQDGSGLGVFGQRYNPSFGKIGTEFRVNSYTTAHQSEPVVAADAKGNWVMAWAGTGAQDGQGIFVQQYAPDLIFDNGFSFGGLSAWSASATDAGDLSVTSAAGLNNSGWGLQAVVDDTAGLWVQDSSPVDEPRYRARFYFDTNGFDPGEALNHRRVRLFVAFEENPVRRLVTIILRRINGAYSVRGAVRLDDHTLSESPFFPISDGGHFIELDWKRASGPDAEDGQFALWLDGTAVHVAPNIDNSLSAVDFVRMGAISVKPGASGTLFLDEFRSRRVSPLGSF